MLAAGCCMKAIVEISAVGGRLSGEANGQEDT